MFKIFYALLLIAYVNILNIDGFGSFLSRMSENEIITLAKQEISLENRYNDTFVNEVFKDNILLTIEYLKGRSKSKEIDYAGLKRPYEYKFTLKPGETFAFHDDILPEYEGKVVKTTNAHFNGEEGFRSDGYLMGDGVCHLASLLYWVALDAGLSAKSLVNHDFAQIPQVPSEYGVSIYATPGKEVSDQMQNLYITNDKAREIAFVFSYDGNRLTISAEEII